MRNLKLVNLRVLSIILVVIGHSIILYSSSWGYYQTTNKVYFLDILKNIINVIQMPLFFSISGYLFYKKVWKIKFRDVIENKFKRLIIPFLFVGILWMIPIKIIIHYSNYEYKNIYEIIRLLITGQDIGHLWYLVALFIIFILMYFIVKYLLKKQDTKRDILMLIILLLVSIASIKNYYHHYLNDPATYLFYFYIGYLINKYEDNILRLNKYVMLILSAILMVITIITNRELLTYPTAIFTIITLYIIMPNKTTNIISRIDKDSFGIYLFHSPLIYITCRYFANSCPLLVVFLNFIVFGLLSVVLTELILKTKLRFIIGE